MVIFQYNLYIFGIHLWTVLYPKPCYNELCYKEVVVYYLKQWLHDIRCVNITCQWILQGTGFRNRLNKTKFICCVDYFCLSDIYIFFFFFFVAFKGSFLSSANSQKPNSTAWPCNSRSDEYSEEHICIFVTNPIFWVLTGIASVNQI